MALTEGRVAKPERLWDWRHGSRAYATNAWHRPTADQFQYVFQGYQTYTCGPARIKSVD